MIDVASEHAVPWMSPAHADEKLVLGFGPATSLAHEGGTQALCVDGRVRSLPADMPTATRRALISIAGNEDVPEDF